MTSKYTISSRLVGVEIRLGERIDNGSIVYKTWHIYRIGSSKGLGVPSLMSLPDPTPDQSHPASQTVRCSFHYVPTHTRIGTNLGLILKPHVCNEAQALTAVRFSPFAHSYPVIVETKPPLAQHQDAKEKPQHSSKTIRRKRGKWIDISFRWR